NNQPLIDKFVLEFTDVFKTNNDFAKKHYPKLWSFFIARLKEKSDFENIVTIKAHIKNINEYIKNANDIPSTKLITLQRLLFEYQLLHKADSFNQKVNDYLKENQSSIEYCMNAIENELNKTTTQPTIPQKEIQPIKWQKQSVLLAYLINELKTYGFIDEGNIWAICEQVFVDKKGNPIKAQTFTSMVKNYENNQTPDGRKGKPKEHTELTELVTLLKTLSKEIDKP
ncbi:MAG: hypothetical protein LC134_06980, partial [Chitinophagales bacterium]|nr:hypothetical protein [Chitinophagales bacterium]